MWSRGLRAPWSFNPLGFWRKSNNTGSWQHDLKPPQLPRLYHVAAAAGGFQAASTALGRLAGGVVLGAGGVLAAQNSSDVEAKKKERQQLPTSQIPWVQELASKSDEVSWPGQELRNHPVASLFVDQDHLFETMIQSKQIGEFRCFYEKAGKKFHSVVQLGKDVCGFPQTVHGGLTAAIVDETLAGLGVCMWRTGKLGVRPPAYTARLEVEYSRTIPAGSTILVTAELDKVEGRKIWMRATVSDGMGTQFAKGKALFVAPRMPQDVLVGRFTKDGKLTATTAQTQAVRA